MQIALLSDIHGNLPALEAVLDDLPAVDEIVCAGDVVGYNPWPAECVERIRNVSSVTVQGNHDRTVETPERYAGNRMAEAGLEHAKTELSDEQRAWLADLPPRTTIADDRYRLVHSHPDPDRLGAYVRPRQFTEMGQYVAAYDGLILGHTHVQHAETVDGRLIVNPGSVGQPRDGDPDAAYAILDAEAGAVDLRRVSYDINTVINAIEAAGLPRRTGTRLLDGS